MKAAVIITFLLGFIMGMYTIAEVKPESEIFPQYAHTSTAWEHDDEIGAEYMDRSEGKDTEELFGHYIEYVATHHIDWNHMVIFIELDGSLLDGTDMSCIIFAQMMKQLTDYDMLVYITNKGWIPTRRNPIDEWWADKLVAETL
jgi:hypothetical protein